MPAQLDHDLERLLIGTNDQRRRVGQAFFHFYKTLIFWADQEVSFFDSARMWSRGGAAIFEMMSRTLRDMLPHEEDSALRAFVGETLAQLADDLERGDHTRTAYIRWLEARFPTLTEMMRDEQPDSRVFDYSLAVDLAETFTLIAVADRRGAIELLRKRVRTLDDQER